MCLVKVVFDNVNECEKVIRCVDWEIGKRTYTFWLDTVDKQESKIISIPIEKVLYVEDIIT